DVVAARLVDRMSVLSEYCLPLCKECGIFMALKCSSSTEKLQPAKKAIKQLGGEFKKEYQFALHIEESERAIIITKKVKNTPKKYPRKPGLPAKQPLS